VTAPGAEQYRVRKADRPLCGARCRTGKPCCARVLVRADRTLARRCRMHGGASTGPKTAEGRARCGAVQRERWARWHAERAAAQSASGGAANDQGKVEGAAA
jgi:hypothetical protein